MKPQFQLGASAYYIPFHEARLEIDELNRAGIELFHVDFFDGNFVDNLGMSPQDISLIRRYTKAKIDVHMAVNRPGRFLPMLAERGADIVYIHPEADLQPAATLLETRRLGLRSGIAVSPGVSFATVEALLPLADYVLIMTVFPGFPNQTYLSYVDGKILEFVKRQKQYGYQILLDGGITEEAVSSMKKYDIGMILGTILFDHGRQDYAQIIRRLREC